MPPDLIIDLDCIAENTCKCIEACARLDVSCSAVVKNAYATQPILNAMKQGGASEFYTSSVDAYNSVVWQPEDQVRLLGLEPPDHYRNLPNGLSGSVHSRLSTFEAIHARSAAARQKHGILLAVEVGDGREGVLPSEAAEIARSFIGHSTGDLEFEGLMMNFACCEMAMPSNAFFKWLETYIEDFETKLGCPVKTVSLGGSVVLDWVFKQSLPDCVTDIRLGEALLFGSIPFSTTGYAQFGRNGFRISGTVIETKKYRLEPTHSVVPNELDRNFHSRIISNIGNIHTNVDALSTQNGPEDISLISYCGEYSVFGTRKEGLEPGDKLIFQMDYIAMARALSSKHVTICYQSS